MTSQDGFLIFSGIAILAFIYVAHWYATNKGLRCATGHHVRGYVDEFGIPMCPRCKSWIA